LLAYIDQWLKEGVIALIGTIKMPGIEKDDINVLFPA
jgi:hypothetical protein